MTSHNTLLSRAEYRQRLAEANIVILLKASDIERGHVLRAIAARPGKSVPDQIGNDPMDQSSLQLKFANAEARRMFVENGPLLIKSGIYKDQQFFIDDCSHSLVHAVIKNGPLFITADSVREGLSALFPNCSIQRVHCETLAINKSELEDGQWPKGIPAIQDNIWHADIHGLDPNTILPPSIVIDKVKCDLSQPGACLKCNSPSHTKENCSNPPQFRAPFKRPPIVPRTNRVTPPKPRAPRNPTPPNSLPISVASSSTNSSPSPSPNPSPSTSPFLSPASSPVPSPFLKATTALQFVPLSPDPVTNPAAAPSAGGADSPSVETIKVPNSWEEHADDTILTQNPHAQSNPASPIITPTPSRSPSPDANTTIILDEEQILEVEKIASNRVHPNPLPTHKPRPATKSLTTRAQRASQRNKQ